MFSNLIQAWARRMARHVAAVFARTHLTPNTVTMIGLLLNFPVAYFLAQGWLVWGGLGIIFAGVFDMLDGALAKVTGRVTTFGGFLDSTMDRYSEVIIFLGLLIFYQAQHGEAYGGQLQGLVLVYVSITGSLLVSYAKARAEGLGMECKVGWLPRPERILIMAIGCIAATWWNPALLVALWILAIGTNLTAAQRIVHIYLKSKDEVVAQPLTNAAKGVAKDKDKERGHETEVEELARKRWSFRRVGGR